MQSVYFTSPTDWATVHPLGEGLTPLQRYNHCILQPQPAGPQNTRWERVLFLWRDTIGVFYTPSQLSHSLGEGLTPLKRCNRCILHPQPAEPQDTRWERVLPFWRNTLGVFYSPSQLSHSLGEGLTPLKRCNRCILQPQPAEPQDTRWEWVVPLWRDAIGVFYSPNRLCCNYFKVYNCEFIIIKNS